MTLTIPVPDNLDKGALEELNQAAREFIGVLLYREGKLSHGKLAKFLGIGRGQVDDVLGRYGPSDEFTPQQISEQAGALHRLRQTRRP